MKNPFKKTVTQKAVRELENNPLGGAAAVVVLAAAVVKAAELAVVAVQKTAALVRAAPAEAKAETKATAKAVRPSRRKAA